ncbi:MAG: hypothetical protein L6262_04915 [Weeksellaceae bacterium]|nr:hypothetical protein [Weeksellaceae bacterium]
MNQIEIKSSKKKILLLILCLLVFIILEIPLIINPEKYVSTLFRNASFIRISSIIGFVICVFALIAFISVVFTRKMSLIINNEGIIDTSSYVSKGMIPWNDIISIKIIDVMSTKFLLINVKNPKKYVDNETSKIKKSLLQSTLKKYGTPITISSTTLQYDFDKLEKLILDSFENYKSRQ